jgi:hypothetical protein
MTRDKCDGSDDRSRCSDDFCQNSRILGRSSGCRCQPSVQRLAGFLRFRPMKAFLNVWRQFREIDLKNTRSRFNLDPVGFYAAHGGVFVDLAITCLEFL